MNNPFKFLLVFTYTNGFSTNFINGCITKSIQLYNIKTTNNSMVAECKPQDYIKIRHIARSTGGKIKIKSKKGLLFTYLHLLNRKGLFVGGLIGILIINFLCGFIWDIEITGTNRLTKTEIQNFLISQGMHNGVYWKSIDKSAIEDMMMASFDDIAWAHINRFGTKAKVELKETTPKPGISSKAISNLKATKDGTIISAKVFDGWQMIFEGDSVVQGDILVSGVYENPDKKLNLYAHGSGEYLAQVEEPIKLTINRQQSFKKVVSTKKYKTLLFFGINIPLYIGKIPNKNVDITKKYFYLSINSHKIPVGTITTKATLYTKCTKTLSDKELYTLTKNQAKKKATEICGKGEIVSSNIKIDLLPNSATAKGTVIAIENIGEETPLIR